MQHDTRRHHDGSAGDANYGVIGERYADFRRPDPRIAELIEKALGDAQTVLNVGAGAGSYEPASRTVSVRRFENDLSGDLKSGRWEQRFGDLRSEPLFLGSLKIVVGR